MFVVGRGKGANVLFMIDNSGSIRESDPPEGNNFVTMLNFVKNSVKEIAAKNPQTNFAAVTFGSTKLFQIWPQGDLRVEIYVVVLCLYHCSIPVLVLCVFISFFLLDMFVVNAVAAVL